MRIVHGFEAFDDLLAVNRFDRAQLSDTFSRQLNPGDQWMPHAAELPDESPDLIGRGRQVDPVGDGLQLRIWRSLIGEGRAAWLRCTGCSAVQELPVVIHHPGDHDVDDIGVDGAAAAGLIRLSTERAFLDLQDSWCRLLASTRRTA